MYDKIILYGLKFGLMDARGIKKSYDDGFARKFIVFTSHSPVGSAKKLLTEMPYCEVKITSHPLKDAKSYKKEHKDAYLLQLDDFGERGINRDFD